MNSKLLVVSVLALIVAVTATKSLFRPCMRECVEDYSRMKCFMACKQFKKGPSTLSDVLQLVSNEDIWDRYRSELLALVAGSKDNEKGYQIVTEELGATWNVEPTNLNVIADRVSEFGSIYSPLSVKFSDQYYSFLKNIDLFSGSAGNVDKPAYDKLQQKMEDYETQYFEKEIQCAEGYEAVKSFIGVSAQEYKNEYCPELKNIDFEKQRVAQQMHEMETKMDGNLRDVKLAINNFNKLSKNWSDDGALTRIANSVAAGTYSNKFSIEFTQSSGVKTVNSWTKKKKSGFIFSKKTTESRTEIKLANSKYQMKVSAPVIARIPVFPGNWFNANLIAKYKDNRSIWLDKSKNFFGDGGSMSMIPTEYYVVMNPSIELTVDGETGHAIEQHKKSSFSFGPFQSGKGSGMTIKKNADNTYRVAFCTNDNTFQIVAVKNYVF
jgi:hypothetical protein